MKGNLSEKQINIAELICLGFSNEEIAKDLSMKLATVKWHVQVMFEIYDVKNRTRFAYEYNKQKEVNNDLLPAS